MENPRNDTETRQGARWRFMALLALCVLLSHAWMGSLSFQLDDFEQLWQAANPERAAVLLGQDDFLNKWIRMDQTPLSAFRPILHYSVALEIFIFGADPMALHWISVLMHLLVCVLLYLSLLRLLPNVRHVPELGALVFALHPGKWGAVSWVMARGDILMTVFFLLSLLSLAKHRRSSGTWWAIISGFWLVLGMLSKEAAVVAPLLIVLIDVTVLLGIGRHLFSRKVIPDLAILMLIPLFFLLRQLYFGDNAMNYIRTGRPLTESMIQRMFQDIGPSVSLLISGYFRPSSPMALAASIFSVFAIVGAIAWTRLGLTKILGILLLLLSYGIAVAPGLRIYRESWDFDVSRIFYFPFVFIAVGLALPLSLLWDTSRWRRRTAEIFLVCLVALTGFSAHLQIQDRKHATEIVNQVVSDVEEFVAKDGEGLLYVLRALPPDVNGIPAFGGFCSFAFLEPFVDRTIPVRSVLDDAWYFQKRDLKWIEQPARVLKWQGTEAGLIAETGILPPPTKTPRVIDFPAGQMEVGVSPSLAPRGIETIRLDFLETPRAPFTLALDFTDANSRSHAAQLDWDPALGTLDHAFVDVSGKTSWLFLEGIRKFHVRTESGETPGIRQVIFGEQPPRIRLISPVEGQEVSFRGPEPVFIFDDPSPCEIYRLRISLPQNIVRTFRRDQLLARDGHQAIRLSQEGMYPAERRINWSQLSSGEKPDLLDSLGLDRLNLVWTIEGYRGQLDHPQSLSETGRAVFVK